MRVLMVFGFAWLADALIASAAAPLSLLSILLRAGVIALLPVGLVATNVIAPAEVRSLVARVRTRRIRVTRDAEDAIETQAFDADGQSPDDTRIG